MLVSNYFQGRVRATYSLGVLPSLMPLYSTILDVESVISDDFFEWWNNRRGMRLMTWRSRVEENW